MNSTPVARPGGLTAVCILAIVLGALGLLTGLSAIVISAVQGPLQNLVNQMQPDGDDEAAQLQRQMSDESRQFAERHFVRNIVLAVVRLVVAGGLLAGGVLAFRLRPVGRKVLLFAFVAGIGFELCQIWPMIEAAQLTQKIMGAQQFRGLEDGNENAQAQMRVMMKAIAAMQVAMLAAMVLTKMSFYGFGWWYVTRPRIASLFVRPAAVEGEWR